MSASFAASGCKSFLGVAVGLLDPVTEDADRVFVLGSLVSDAVAVGIAVVDA